MSLKLATRHLQSLSYAAHCVASVFAGQSRAHTLCATMLMIRVLHVTLVLPLALYSAAARVTHVLQGAHDNVVVTLKHA